MKKYINRIQEIAFCGLITFIFLIISLEFLEWAVKFSFKDGVLGFFYLSLNMFGNVKIDFVFYGRKKDIFKIMC